ncbi:MAG: glycerophosphodiester phosphodiesterase family protein [Pseudomonadota bacterium]
MAEPLDPGFLTSPIAHRGLHGGRDVENSVSAIRAASAAGFAVEIDIQPSADGVAMVFHDTTLDRLTEETGRVDARPAAALRKLRLAGSEDEIPSLAHVLQAIGGTVPLLIEIKDQDGALGPDIGDVHQAVARELLGYAGAVAVMSFNPDTVAAFAEALPHVPRGLVIDAMTAEHWPDVPAERRKRLAAVEDAARLDIAFASCNRTYLNAAPVAALKDRDLPILTWTIRSPEEEADARRIADNITFEGYHPTTP